MAFLTEVLLAAATDARNRGDLRAARACYRDVLKAEPHNADALAGIAALEAKEVYELETTVSLAGEPPWPSVPLLGGADLEELPPEPTLPPQADSLRLPERPPRAVTYARAAKSAAAPLPAEPGPASVFPEPFLPPRPHLAAAGRRVPSLHWNLLALLAGLVLLAVTRSL